MTEEILTADSPLVTAFLKAWHENGRKDFEKSYTNLVYDDYAPKTATERRRFIALDCGRSGVFLVERYTLHVYRIKGYGVPNLNKYLGTLPELTAAYNTAASESRTLGYASF